MTTLSGNAARMGVLWSLVRTISTIFAVIIAVLVVVDGSLLANLFKKADE